MTISLCGDDDIERVGEFYDRVVYDLCNHINYPKWSYKRYPSTDSVRAAVNSRSQFVCRSGDEIIAAFVLNDDPQGAYHKAQWSKRLNQGEYAVCHALAVAPEQRGKGAGRRIVVFCKRYALQRGYKAIRLDVVPDNLPARKLYESCGFRYVGDEDLDRGYDNIPLFSLYEYNLQI